MNDGKNPINRYIINSPMLPDLKDADGSLTLYIQNASPGSDKESNWLPGRDGPIYLLRATGRSPNLPPGEPPGFSSAAQWLVERCAANYVRFGSKADMMTPNADVRFVPLADVPAGLAAVTQRHVAPCHVLVWQARGWSSPGIQDIVVALQALSPALALVRLGAEHLCWGDRIAICDGRAIATDANT